MESFWAQKALSAFLPSNEEIDMEDVFNPQTLRHSENYTVLRTSPAQLNEVGYLSPGTEPDLPPLSSTAYCLYFTHHNQEERVEKQLMIWSDSQRQEPQYIFEEAVNCARLVHSLPEEKRLAVYFNPVGAMEKMILMNDDQDIYSGLIYEAGSQLSDSARMAVKHIWGGDIPQLDITQTIKNVLTIVGSDEIHDTMDLLSTQ